MSPNHSHSSAQPEIILSSQIRNNIRKLTLTHFRNYHNCSFESGAQSVVLVGPNGAGKTNLLEAISLLTPGRGLRRAPLSDIDNIEDHAPWAIAAEISGAQGEALIGTGRDMQAQTDKRIVKIDGKVAKSQNELARYLSALWLTPQMDNLFIEGGTARRKFLDRLVYSFDAEHVSRVNAYDFAMRERNRLLQTGRADPAWLAALEQKMAEQGVAIAIARAHAAERLNQVITHAQHSFPQAQLYLAGAVEEVLVLGSALAAEESFKTILLQNRGQDGASGRALAGIHRTRVEVIHAEKNMPAERCSTGEQKALLVSIILGQARAGATWHGIIPVLLLDEVATHLDATRRAELFTELTEIGAQAWLTGTDEEVFTGLEARVLRVEQGVVTQS